MSLECKSSDSLFFVAMNRKTIDQTASELQLHRVLYLITFLRAMVLHVTLLLVAALLYFLTGIDNAYPVGTAALQAFRAQGIAYRVQGSAMGSMGFLLPLAFVLLAVLALLVWMYRSITNVRRSALRVQAVLMLIIALLSIPAFWPNLQFAFRHLNPLFAVLATLGVAVTMVIVPMSVILRLRGVARLTERSSLVATLDPRLAPNWWVYVNKLLDLPRTPLRTARTAGAYVLALAGALLMIASMMYLITVGGASNKLATLKILAEHDLMQESIAVSAIEVRQILLLLPCALAGVKFAALLQSTAKRLGGLSVSEVIKNPEDKFLLYLRPFDLDDVILPKPRLSPESRFFSFRPYPVRIEEELFDVADGYRPLIAVGKPGGVKPVQGGVAYRTYLDDSNWQTYVEERIRRAERIVMVVAKTEGVRWEFERIINEGALSKTLIFFHPQFRETGNWRAVEALTVALLQKAGVVPAAFTFSCRPIGFFFQKGNLVEIVNANWSAISYRTAFSHFLAEPL
jgi:hypothetical protein